jgi:broad specificity polyphosphatase/5'/3'-nucleotidase SurE
MRFYEPTPPEEKAENVKALGYDVAGDYDQSPPGTDSHAVVNQRIVAVTPLSLDLTSRVDLNQLAQLLKQE